MKLNNCPFCNNELDTGDVLDIGRLAFCVHCPSCLAYGPKAQSKEAAIEKWNGTLNSIELLKKIEFIREMAAEDIRLCNDGKTSLHSIEANARALVLELSYEVGN